MKQTDVVILYEHKLRDLENACLLAYKLEQKGYSTCIYNIYESIKNRTQSKVLIVPHLYNNEQLYSFGLQGDRICPFIIDMQYEQVLCSNEEDGIHNPSGQAVNAYHLAWGQSQVDRYLKHNIPERNVFLTGHVAMDLLRPEYTDYFKTRVELGTEFHLDVEKEWVMFLSSFSYCNRTEEEMIAYEKMYADSRRLARISEESLKRLIAWFEQFCIDNPNKILIYRSHPAEKDDVRLAKLEHRFPNFKIISKYSLRQWMKPVDCFFNWYSTSIIDVYFADKPCYILRPIQIPSEMEVEVLQGASTITSYVELKKSMERTNFVFPVSSQLIEYYYGEKSSIQSSDKIVDVVEGMMNGIYQPASYNLKELMQDQPTFSLLKRTIYRLIVYLGKHFDLTILSNYILKSKKKQFEIFQKDLLGYTVEVENYKCRFKKVLTKI